MRVFLTLLFKELEEIMIAKYDLFEFRIERRSFDSIKPLTSYLFDRTGY